MQFLGLGLADRVPDARTIWLFREKLTPTPERSSHCSSTGFNAALREAGYIAMLGEADHRRHAHRRAQAAQYGGGEDGNQGRPDSGGTGKPSRPSSGKKDRDARWTVKFSKAKERANGSKPAVDIAIPTFGYQNHVSIDRQYGLIRRWDARPTRRLTRARGYARDCSTRPTPRAWCGRTRPIDRRSTRSSSPRTASSVAFTEASSAADAGDDAARQCPQVRGPLARRARLRDAERQNGALHPDHRHSQGDDEDRHGKHRLQREEARLPRQTRRRMKRRRTRCRHAWKTPNRSPRPQRQRHSGAITQP